MSFPVPAPSSEMGVVLVELVDVVEVPVLDLLVDMILFLVLTFWAVHLQVEPIVMIR